ncbi:tyrosine-type recombinase/integrase [Thioalkalivibrio thiocyanodenitrificans]|uniref:tyrosine-type recombinase/integrase n=1 Tax=Thioalkalivibrio thiocyanodenitrificans TaxID=243063 RepID=UPI000380F46B|nr:integrase family protein [Thioalkalivibrio thiocyanodenitrificans]
MKLNATTIKSVQAPQSGYVLLWDDDLQGFGLRVTAKGAKSYIVQAKIHGKTVRHTLGKHGVLTPDQARKRAKAKLGDMAEGKNPVAEKRRKKALSVTLADVTDAYLDSRRTRAGKPLKERTKKDVRYHLDGTFSEWKDKPVAEITRDMVLTRYKAKCKTSVAQANQSMRVLSALLNYAGATYRTPEGTRIIQDNPVEVLRDANVLRAVAPKKSMVPLDRLGEWWSAVQAMRADPALTPASRSAADLVALLAVTGLRLGEARSICWDQIEDASLRLTDTKNRTDVRLPLSDLAMEIIEARRNKTPFVFPARSGKGHLKDCRGQLMILAEKTGVDVTAHDLRRTFRTVAAKVGVELWRTKALMNHKQDQDITLAHYADLSDVRDLKPEADRIAQFFEEQKRVFEAGNVVTLERKA